MRIFIVITAIILLTGNSLATDLGNQMNTIKTKVPGDINSGLPDGREGGETIETAWPIAALPFNDTGNTSDNINDYDEACPYIGSPSPDVVYSFTPTMDLTVSVDLCGSSYDTKTYIYNEDMNVVACNDDFYTDTFCGPYVSKIENAPLLGGHTYYIIIDGFGGDSGDYILEVTDWSGTIGCILECDGQEEGEPPLQDGYVDTYNTGCNDDTGLFPFQTLAGDVEENLNFCGQSGWYSPDFSANHRDTDWFIVEIGSLGMVEWTLEAEYFVYGFLLGPQDCDEVGVLETIMVECDPVTLTLQGNPGDLLWIWVGPTEYEAPLGFIGHEFPYLSHFTGLAHDGIVATDRISFDGLKTLYR